MVGGKPQSDVSDGGMCSTTADIDGQDFNDSKIPIQSLELVMSERPNHYLT